MFPSIEANRSDGSFKLVSYSVNESIMLLIAA